MNGINEVIHYGNLNGQARMFFRKLFPFSKDRVRFFHYQSPLYYKGKFNYTGMDEVTDYFMFKYHLKDLDFKTKKHRAITLALDNDGFIGIALCSKEDQYVRKIGNKIALDRLKKFKRKI